MEWVIFIGFGLLAAFVQSVEKRLNTRLDSIEKDLAAIDAKVTPKREEWR